ncbi:hypothetical protein LMUP508_01121 [Limosilactobacillus mucosae]|uniref:Uncharacterized protein n=1 Tax=Limosilactobacillus mucosae TaxID=97478 RepID=A0A508YNI5_LIMMU|nr:hypothetical protein LMUP508_01121 [Limosilactobacillus mucosae]
MSSKRAKRHQLIVIRSNSERADTKHCGFKMYPLIREALKNSVCSTPKPRLKNWNIAISQEISRAKPSLMRYKDKRTEMFRMLLFLYEPTGKLKGLGTIK